MNGVPYEILSVAKALSDYYDQILFVGGAIVPLLLSDPAAAPPRPTEDVDIAIEVASYTDYTKFESQLRSAGFTQLLEESKLFRWHRAPLVLDVVAIDEIGMGGQNRWYASGFAHAVINESSELPIKHLDAPHFIATKFDAFRDRGQGNLLTSHDIEDIVCVIDGRPELLSETQNAPDDLRLSVQESLRGLIRERYAEEVIESCLARSGEVHERTGLVLRRIHELSEI